MAAWNPLDSSASITLSNTNHTATGATGNHCTRGTTHHGSNKWYLEYSAINWGGSGAGAIGFAYASNGLDTSTVSGLWVDPGGSLHDPVGGTFAGTNPQGHILSFAVDLGQNKAWLRIDNGAWIGAGGSSGAGVDPVAGSGGIDISGRGANDFYPFAFLQAGTSPTLTLNPGDSAFSETQPSGFTAWDSTPPPSRFSATVIA